jgi:hypothetical protein
MDHHKTCTGCKRDLPLTDYWDSARGLYGKRSQCKSCMQADRQKQRNKKAAAKNTEPPPPPKLPKPASARERQRAEREVLLQMGLCYCPVCKQTLPTTDFRVDKSRSTGLTYKCKACQAIYDVQYAAKHIDAKRARARQYQRERRSGERPAPEPDYKRTLFAVVPSAPILEAVGKTHDQLLGELMARRESVE